MIEIIQNFGNRNLKQIQQTRQHYLTRKRSLSESDSDLDRSVTIRIPSEKPCKLEDLKKP